eukprot:Colp12_sorted_trinity150504_noHs@5050
MKTLLLLSALVALCAAQVPIPSRPPGLTYSGKADAPIQLDAFLDLLCPDSKAAWPTLKALATSYGNETFRLNVHLFPLPYHHNAFIATRAAFALVKSQSPKLFDYIDTVFDKQDQYADSTTEHKTETEIEEEIVSLAGLPANTKLRTQYDVEMATRIAWKYACTRGVAGTPWFFVNGVAVAGESTWTVANWRTVLDPLVRPQLLGAQETCPANTVQCEYLPGKTECCTPGEYCIPNVGCRC